MDNVMFIKHDSANTHRFYNWLVEQDRELKLK